VLNLKTAFCLPRHALVCAKDQPDPTHRPLYVASAPRYSCMYILARGLNTAKVAPLAATTLATHDQATVLVGLCLAAMVYS
jgi:hypothetical protein